MSWLLRRMWRPSTQAVALSRPVASTRRPRLPRCGSAARRRPPLLPRPRCGATSSSTRCRCEHVPHRRPHPAHAQPERAGDGGIGHPVCRGDDLHRLLARQPHGEQLAAGANAGLRAAYTQYLAAPTRLHQSVPTVTDASAAVVLGTLDVSLQWAVQPALPVPDTGVALAPVSVTRSGATASRSGRFRSPSRPPPARPRASSCPIRRSRRPSPIRACLPATRSLTRSPPSMPMAICRRCSRSP